MDVAISAKNMYLEATALGIGSCIIGMFDRVGVKELLGLNQNIVPHLFVSLGYPDKRGDVSYSRNIPQLSIKRSVKNTVIGWIK
jgi:nitroreductase